ncbi:uncharacterized protein DFL_006892 [Arthrobotrys flagrans]|uniref:Uncharacterized protein n=1 Tax=Arthrobotrys flagrans TaxID=97331 RepID=A0A436ZUR1_ARTFL|nr:hypothetical protein DFL_006892 [Arthrobotrys flagrans]
MESKIEWAPCPLFVQAVYRRDLQDASEHWGTRMRREHGGSSGLEETPDNCVEPFEYVMKVAYDLEAAKELLALKDYIPTSRDLFNLTAVLAVVEGLNETEIEGGFALITTAI